MKASRRLYGTAVLLLLGAGCDLEENKPTVSSLPLAWRTAGAFDWQRIVPALTPGRLFMGDNASVSAYDTDTGRLLWKNPVSGSFYNVFADAGRVFTNTRTAHAFDAATGAKLWDFTPSLDTLGFAHGTAGDGRVFVGSVGTARVYALDAATGRLLWQRQIRQPDWKYRNSIVSLTLHEGVLYAQADRSFNDNGFFKATHIVALDPATGEELWRYVDGNERTTNQAGRGLAFAGNLVLYADHYEGFVAAFDRTTRTLAWKYDLPNQWIGPFVAPTVSEGVAYAGSGDGVYAFDAATGALKWKSRMEGSNDNQAVCGRWVGGSSTGSIAYDKATGKRGPNIHMTGTLVSSKLISDGRRFYLSASDGVYAYDCTG